VMQKKKAGGEAGLDPQYPHLKGLRRQYMVRRGGKLEPLNC
jgi:hypothetical protein